MYEHIKWVNCESLVKCWFMPECGIFMQATSHDGHDRHIKENIPQQPELGTWDINSKNFYDFL